MNLHDVRNALAQGKSIFDITLKVTFYARVSTDSDAQLNSLDNQVFYFEDYIKKCPNWTFVKGYVDEGLSGTTALSRENFMSMIDDAKKGSFDLILTKEISRFSRSTLDSIKYTQELLSCGVGVLFQSDNINTILPDSELRLAIMSSVAQEEVRKLSERIRFGMKRSIEKERVLGNNNIWGYTKDDGSLVIYEPQAQMIRRLFSLYAEDKYGFQAISNMLASEGFINSKGEKFSASTLTNMIKNPKYKGFYATNKMKSLDYRNNLQKRVPMDEWVVYDSDGKIPSIVSAELWDRANAILQKRSTSFSNRKNDKAIFQHRYAFSGRIYCKENGVTFQRANGGSSRKKNSNSSYICRDYLKEGLKGCESPILYESELYDIARSVIKDLQSNKDDVLSILRAEYTAAMQAGNANQEIVSLKKQIDEVASRKDKLLDLATDGSLDNIEFKRRNDACNQQLIELESKLKSAEVEKSKSNDVKALITRAEEALTHSNADENIDELIKLLIDKIIVSKVDNNRAKVRLDIYLTLGETVSTVKTFDRKAHRQPTNIESIMYASLKLLKQKLCTYNSFFMSLLSFTESSALKHLTISLVYTLVSLRVYLYLGATVQLPLCGSLGSIKNDET